MRAPSPVTKGSIKCFRIRFWLTGLNNSEAGKLVEKKMLGSEKHLQDKCHAKEGPWWWWLEDDFSPIFYRIREWLVLEKTLNPTQSQSLAVGTVPPTSSVSPGPHLTWPWIPAGMGHPHLLRAAWSAKLPQLPACISDDISVSLIFPREKQRTSRTKGISSSMPVIPLQTMERTRCLTSVYCLRTNTWLHCKGMLTWTVPMHFHGNRAAVVAISFKYYF